MSIEFIENINLREKTMKNALQTVIKIILKYFLKKKTQTSKKTER